MTSLWPKDSAKALAVRNAFRSQTQSNQSDKPDKSDPSGQLRVASASPETAANTLICLINQASYLLGRQLKALEQQFLSEGGFTEKLYRTRQQRRFQP